MSKALVLLLTIVTVASQSAGACTIFRSPFAGDSQIAHNVDWFEQVPNVKGIVALNPAPVRKKGTVFGMPMKTAEWNAVWKSVTFSIVGAEFPTSGFNEKGLFMGLLMMNDSKYPDANDSRPALGITQFVQYNLDTSATIEDVIESGQSVRPFSPSFKMHYFACDASAKCVILQYVNGEVVAYSGKDLPQDVLTNSLYPASVEAAKTCGERSCSQSNISLWRFGQAAWQREALQASSSPNSFTREAFNILDNVAQTKGITTRFQLVYDPERARMNIRTGDASRHAWVDIDFRQIRCGANRKVIALGEKSRGNLSGEWQNLTPDMQYNLAVSAGMPAATATEISHYISDATSCQ